MGDLQEILPEKGLIWPHLQVLARFKKRRDEPQVLFPLLDKFMEKDKSLKQARTCLSIGPAEGQNDLDFLDRCLPNLTKYIAIDKQASSLKFLRINFQKIFGNSVEYEDHEIDAADLKLSEDEKVDIVWMSHMLYTIPKEKRLNIFEKLLKDVIKPETGVIIIVNNTKDNFFQKLHIKLGIRPLLSSDEVKQDIVKMGGTIIWNQVYSIDFDITSYDHDIWNYLMECSDRTLTPSEIMRAAKAISSSGTPDYQSEICVVKCN